MECFVSPRYGWEVIWLGDYRFKIELEGCGISDEMLESEGWVQHMDGELRGAQDLVCSVLNFGVNELGDRGMKIIMDRFGKSHEAIGRRDHRHVLVLH